MPGNTDHIDEIISTLIDSHLKLASITSGLLFACRTANQHNENVNIELDTTSKDIDDYIEKVAETIREFRERRRTIGRT